MRMDKLTSKFQAALADAQSLALGRDHQFVEPLHVMQALLDQQGGSVRPLLDKTGANVNLLRSQLGEAIERLPRVEGTGGDVHISNDLNRLLNLTDKLAQKRGDQFITSEQFMVAALEDKGALAKILANAGVVKSGEAQVLTKGPVSLALAGNGEGVNIGVDVGQFTISQR